MLRESTIMGEKLTKREFFIIILEKREENLKLIKKFERKFAWHLSASGVNYSECCMKKSVAQREPAATTKKRQKLTHQLKCTSQLSEFQRINLAIVSSINVILLSMTPRVRCLLQSQKSNINPRRGCWVHRVKMRWFQAIFHWLWSVFCLRQIA